MASLSGKELGRRGTLSIMSTLASLPQTSHFAVCRVPSSIFSLSPSPPLLPMQTSCQGNHTPHHWPHPFSPAAHHWPHPSSPSRMLCSMNTAYKWFRPFRGSPHWPQRRTQLSASYESVPKCLDDVMCNLIWCYVHMYVTLYGAMFRCMQPYMALCCSFSRY